MKSRKARFKELWLAGNLTYCQIGEILNREGFKTRYKRKFSSKMVQYYGCNVYKLGPKGKPIKGLTDSSSAMLQSEDVSKKSTRELLC